MEIQRQIKIRDADFIIATGKMAKQADGAVTVQHRDTVVLVTAVSSSILKEDIDFFPLTVDYREKTSAAGKIPGGYIKREARPTEKETLTARLIDRPIRPLFPKGYFYEVQVMVNVLSADPEIDPDVLAVNGASAALMISDIPFDGPVGAVRVGYINNEYVVNPTYSELEDSRLDIVVAGALNGVTMIEGGAKELPEEVLLGAIEFAQDYIVQLINLQLELKSTCGVPKRDVELILPKEELLAKVKELSREDLYKAVMIKEKLKRQEAIKLAFEKIKSTIKEEFPEVTDLELKMACDIVERYTVRDLILNEGKRCDGRTPDEIRSISCEVGLLPRTHGSALFTRGETQSLAMTTLGTKSDEQRVEELIGEFSKSFMLHYNFPPFSVGEVKPARGPGRREIGHGALAERALSPVIPPREEFPYTIRVVSDILESNGSSSMATVCGGSLSLMDAGVPIKAAVGGIAMGLVKGNGKVVILTDIIGAEDACGDMDFKVAGTREGITAFQLDVKLKEGIDLELLKEGLEKARKARLYVLDKMAEAIAEPRKQISVYAPKIKMTTIPPDKIGLLIGPGGRVIKRIMEDTGATVEIEDDGNVFVSSTNEESISRAIRMIKDITKDVEVGEIYEGVVRNIVDFGAFVEIMPGKVGLVHISELSNRYVKRVEDFVKIGEKIKVMVIKIDDKGRIVLSKKRISE